MVYLLAGGDGLDPQSMQNGVFVIGHFERISIIRVGITNLFAVITATSSHQWDTKEVYLALPLIMTCHENRFLFLYPKLFNWSRNPSSLPVAIYNILYTLQVGRQ